MCGIFEKYSTTKDDPKSKFRPLVSNNSALRTYETIKKFVEDEGFEDILCKKDFFEIYCTDYGYEITFTIIGNDMTSSIVNIAVYGESKRGKTRRKLKRLIDELANSL